MRTVDEIIERCNYLKNHPDRSQELYTLTRFLGPSDAAKFLPYYPDYTNPTPITQLIISTHLRSATAFLANSIVIGSNYRADMYCQRIAAWLWVSNSPHYDDFLAVCRNAPPYAPVLAYLKSIGISK
jgi:hypothetical protein